MVAVLRLQASAALFLACVALAPVAVLTLSTAPAGAQTAADKATARKLATDGIKLYRSKEYADALDKLQRAQALYDAPIHLLYIARCQVALGQLVEGSETYRALGRAELGPGAPKPFVDAKASGETELSQLVPRIPTLTIEIEPAGIENLELFINEQPLASAVVGVERPVNPGEHTVTAKARGYHPAEQTVAVAEGAAERVVLTLAVNPDDVVPEPGAEPAATSPGVPDSSEPAPPEPRADFGFEVGIRGGGLLSSGQIVPTVDITDVAQGGGGAEIYAALRLFKYFGVGGFYNRHWIKAGTAVDQSINDFLQRPREINSTVTFESAGVLVRAGTERGQFGGFAEVGFEFLHKMNVNRDVSGLPLTLACSMTQGFSGTALRVGGGAILPLNRWVRLTPMLTLSFSTFGSTDIVGDCLVEDENMQSSAPEPLLGQPAGDINPGSGHRFLFLGVGGDFLFGDD